MTGINNIRQLLNIYKGKNHCHLAVNDYKSINLTKVFEYDNLETWVTNYEGGTIRVSFLKWEIGWYPIKVYDRN